MAFEISENFDVKKAWTFDHRQFRASFADLLEFTPDDYIRNGFPVAVWDDADETKRGIWTCIDENNLHLEASWKKQGGGVDAATDEEEIEGATTVKSATPGGRSAWWSAVISAAISFSGTVTFNVQSIVLGWLGTISSTKVLGVNSSKQIVPMDFGTTDGTVAAGDHAHTGVYEPVITKNTGFNQNLSTSGGTNGTSSNLAREDHTHTGMLTTSSDVTKQGVKDHYFPIQDAGIAHTPEKLFWNKIIVETTNGLVYDTTVFSAVAMQARTLAGSWTTYATVTDLNTFINSTAGAKYKIRMVPTLVAGAAGQVDIILRAKDNF